ncbi:MAG: ABC transporter ATP-binding protein [Candidatus Bipolaricaulota bacterium]
MIRVKNLDVLYENDGGSKKIISGLNLRVSDGDSLCIIGPNGCGKTTLLHTLAGLHGKYTGEMDIEVGAERVALILQDIGLLPWKTVRQNASLGLDLGHTGDKSTVDTLLRELDLYDYRNELPSQLSGGQKRKLGLARALAVKPKVLLMDEPLVSLDEFTREELQNKILKLWLEKDLTLLTVTHDMEEAAFLGQNIAVLSSPPASLKTLIKNREAGSVDYRGSEEFYETVRKTRRELP